MQGYKPQRNHSREQRYITRCNAAKRNIPEHNVTYVTKHTVTQHTFDLNDTRAPRKDLHGSDLFLPKSRAVNKGAAVEGKCEASYGHVLPAQEGIPESHQPGLACVLWGSKPGH